MTRPNGQIRKTLAKHGSYGRLFHVLLDARDEDAMTLAWEYEPELLDQKRRLLGKYVLATSLDKKTRDVEAVLELYKSRHLVEHRFRTTKSTLKVRPVFLQKDERISALVLVMVIALIVYALIEYVVKQERLATSAKQALLMFRMPAIVTLRVNGQIMQQIGNIKPFMLEILAALNVKPLELRGGVDTG